MPEEFDFQKLKEEYPEFFKQFSPGLLEFIFSEETFSKIAEICLENEVEDEEKIEKIAYRVALALLDEVPKENLDEIFEKGVGINIETAKKISIEIKRLIFSQIPTAKSTETPSPSPTLEKEKPGKPSKEDAYRETTE